MVRFMLGRVPSWREASWRTSCGACRVGEVTAKGVGSGLLPWAVVYMKGGGKGVQPLLEHAGDGGFVPRASSDGRVYMGWSCP